MRVLCAKELQLKKSELARISYKYECIIILSDFRDSDTIRNKENVHLTKLLAHTFTVGIEKWYR